MWPFSKPGRGETGKQVDEQHRAFREAVEREFTPLARECGDSLHEVDTWIFGFCAPHAVLTVGAYPGHYRSICVKIRYRDADNVPSVRDGADIGLANIDFFVTGQMSEVFKQRREAWASAPIEREIAALSAKTREIAMPFLKSPAADWDGVRGMIAERIEKAAEEHRRKSRERSM
jgi:hypothetical protein